MWMEKFKKFLALSLLLTLIWLLDVFVALSSTDALFSLNITLTMIFFALFFWHKISKNRFWRAVIIILTLLTIIPLQKALTISEQPISSSSGETIIQAHELKWERWTPQKMARPGQVSFVDFTAKWCFTCKANEKAVIDTEAFRSLVKKYNVKLLLADWTKRDAIIGNWLKEHGYAGVPVYFVVNANGDLESLGETISIKKIEDALKRVESK
jgi:thiol:disulfide interchange protein DsbD